MYLDRVDALCRRGPFPLGLPIKSVLQRVKGVSRGRAVERGRERGIRGERQVGRERKRKGGDGGALKGLERKRERQCVCVRA